MTPTRHTVLITGGATGIGFAIARKFHAAGNRVILAGRSEIALSKAADALPGAETHAADVSSSQDRERLVNRFPDITILVNNAGIQVNKTIAESTQQDIEQEFNVNFLAPVLLSRAYLPRLLQQPVAAIINVSSGLALVPKQDAAIYCASKAALHGFSKALRWQLEGTGVRVFEVLPPMVATAMNSGRGKGKISPEQFADEFWEGFMADKHEMLIGKTKLLFLLNRLAPSLADKIMRHGL